MPAPGGSPYRAPMTITYTWRGSFANAELNALHADAFGHDPTQEDWLHRLEQHSLGWVTARAGGGRLLGFVNVAWDGGIHAFLLDTVVAPNSRHDGIGTRLVETARDAARAAGCRWLHVDFAPELSEFYLGASGFRPTAAGLVEL